MVYDIMYAYLFFRMLVQTCRKRNTRTIYRVLSCAVRILCYTVRKNTAVSATSGAYAISYVDSENMLSKHKAFKLYSTRPTTIVCGLCISALLVDNLSLHFVHYSDAIMSTMASQITCVPIVGSTFCSGAEKTWKLRVTGLCEGNPQVTGGSLTCGQ